MRRRSWKIISRKNTEFLLWKKRKTPWSVSKLSRHLKKISYLEEKKTCFSFSDTENWGGAELRRDWEKEQKHRTSGGELLNFRETEEIPLASFIK